MTHPEQKFWQLLKNNHVLPGDVSRVENTADVGTPDLTCAFVCDYWTELKVCDRVIAEFGTGTTNALLTKDLNSLLLPSQKVWHARRVKQNSLIFVLIQYPDYIILWLCVGPEEYDMVATAKRKGNSYDYSVITAAVQNLCSHN